MNRSPFLLLLGLFLLSTGSAWAGDLQVTGLFPPRNATAPVNTVISITFDRPLSRPSINAASFRVFGRSSGNSPGTFSFSNGDRTVTFTRTRPLSAGEVVWVNLSHNIVAVDLSPLRSAGYAYQFMTAVVPTPRQFTQLDVMSNRTNNQQTRIYGASSSDLNEDGFLDLTTVNEVSADVRVFLNLADGSGMFGDFLTPQSIGVEASPNEPDDFNNDGHADLCTAATKSNSVWVLLGSGDGTFGSITEIPVGQDPHGIATLDVDGDGDRDIVNSNNSSDNLSLLVNDGNGGFGAPIFFDSGIGSEYGLASADMNNDGITDVVVTGRDSQSIITLLGNGNGTFTAAGPAQSSGGLTWVVALGDVNGNGNIDASVANSVSNNGAILFGLGDGHFAPPTLTTVGAHTPATDLGDLDGDGDLDWILSSFGAGLWKVYVNDGSGHFTFDQQFIAPDSPSCAVPFDFDRDGDLDLALTDELADVVVLMENLDPLAAVGDAPPPRRLSLLSNSPEPFSDATHLRFELSEPAVLRLEVFDVAGRRLLIKGLGPAGAGRHDVAFDGRDGAGNRLRSGIYFYRLIGAGSLAGSDRMTIVR